MEPARLPVDFQAGFFLLTETHAGKPDVACMNVRRYVVVSGFCRATEGKRCGEVLLFRTYQVQGCKDNGPGRS